MTEVDTLLSDHAELAHVLGARGRALFAAPPDAPYASDDEFVLACRTTLALHSHRLFARMDQVEHLSIRGADAASADRARAFLEAATRLAALHERHDASRRLATLCAAGPLPRLLALGRLLELTAPEQRLLEGVVAQYAPRSPDQIVARLSDDLVCGGVRGAASFAGMSLSELLAFLDPARRHMREDLIAVTSCGHNVLGGTFELSDEVLSALLGAPLGSEQLMKLDGTALAAVLAAERAAPAPPPASPEAPAATTAPPAPYGSDLEYLGDQFALLETLVALGTEEPAEEGPIIVGHFREQKPESLQRERRARERLHRARATGRLAATLAAGGWSPRLERLVTERHLGDFERFVLVALVGLRIAPTVQRAFEKHSLPPTVGTFVSVWTRSLEERVRLRSAFYKNAPLLREGLVRLEGELGGDLQGCPVAMDRRTLDHLVGLDTEAGELVDGGHLYRPTVDLAQVVLPAEQRALVLETVTSYDTFVRVRGELGLDRAFTNGRALVMLFYGPSGTGKTMLANAIAAHQGKRVLLINFCSLGVFTSDEALRFVFREARMQDAIVFFDECESIFETRDRAQNRGLGLLLTELERHDGLVIMATNRPHDLDEAMHRRITLALEFKQPDAHQRTTIWRNHVPPTLPVAPDVDFEALARKFELTGGFIRNAVLTALSRAVARDGDRPLLRRGDFEEGAALQLRSRLRMKDFDRRVAPTRGLEALVLPDDLAQSLREVVDMEKGRPVLTGQWGFEGYGQGTTALFAGPPGTGKTLAAEALGFELGRPLCVVNCSEVLSKYVGDTPKNIEALFREAHHNDAILVFDEADGLLAARTPTGDATDRYANLDVGLLLYHIERYPGTVVLTTNLEDQLDQALFRRMKFVLRFPRPDRALRERLWRHHVPTRVPLAEDVDFALLASRFELSGGGIKNAVFRAAARAALRPEAARRVTLLDFVAAAESIVDRPNRTRAGFKAA